MALVNSVYFILTISICLGSCYADVSDDEAEKIEYLSKVLNEGLASASTYELPTNAEEYRPLNDSVIEYGIVDYVIVGGGTTGCVTASRLSEIPGASVLVLEAGELAVDDFLQFPSSVFFTIPSKYNWGFNSVSQTTACLGLIDEKCIAPTGKGMGGTTLINGLFYERGDPTTFDVMAEELDDPSWSYQNVLPLFKKSENFVYNNRWAPVDQDYHGTGGYLNVEHVLPSDELSGVFLDANRYLGYNISDYNGPNLEVATIAQFTKKHGRRHDTFSAFLKPVLHRSNLVLLNGSYVTKIEIDKVTKVATGVTFTRSGGTYFVGARKEIILSAGVFSSPRILMLSGIGPAEHLKEIGIDIIEDIEVGSVLIDDVATNSILFASDLYFPSQTQEETVKDYLHGSGTLTKTFSSQGAAYYKSKLYNDLGLVDFEIVALTQSKSFLVEKIANWQNETYSAIWGNYSEAIRMDIILVNPRSRGSVRLASNDPFEFPLIDSKLLSDPDDRDIAVMYEALQLAFDILQTPAFQRLNVKYVGRPLPGCKDYEFLSKEYWFCFLRQTCFAPFHAKGSCPMGTDPKKGAVVDSNFKVFGIEKLRVADSSIFPISPGGHPSATCMMLGEKISDVIKSQYL